MRVLSLLSLSLLLGTSALPAFAADTTPVTRDELGALVKEYLNTHPEVIVESVAIYQKNMAEAGVKEAGKAIAENKSAIYNNPAMPTIGDKTAKVTVVEFFDYNCSACKYMFTTIDKVIKAGNKDVRFIFMEYPIFGEQSEKISTVGLAVYALSPAKYYDFHSHMMAHKGSISVDEAKAYAEKVGVSKDALEKEITKPKYSELHKANAALGEKLKIGGTPFMIIGDEAVPHALDDAGMKEYLDKARK
jgi:protein-disulfide isomerase